MIHVEYSFWRMRLPATDLTLPWQLVAAQEPGPMYFTGSPFESLFESAGLAAVPAGAVDASVAREAEFASCPGPFPATAIRTATAGSSKSAAHSATCGQ